MHKQTHYTHTHTHTHTHTYTHTRTRTHTHTVRTLARQVYTRIDVYLKEREESALRTASIKKILSYVRGRLNPIYCSWSES